MFNNYHHCQNLIWESAVGRYLSRARWKNGCNRQPFLSYPAPPNRLRCPLHQPPQASVLLTSFHHQTSTFIFHFSCHQSLDRPLRFASFFSGSLTRQNRRQSAQRYSWFPPWRDEAQELAFWQLPSGTTTSTSSLISFVLLCFCLISLIAYNHRCPICLVSKRLISLCLSLRPCLSGKLERRLKNRSPSFFLSLCMLSQSRYAWFQISGYLSCFLSGMD